MFAETSVRCFEYVARPYEKVRDALASEGNVIFHEATKLAEAKASVDSAGLHLKIGGVELGKEINVEVISFEEVECQKRKYSNLRFRWQAAENPRLFPRMTANLRIYPITFNQSQLVLEGKYEPPLGLLGKAIDTIVGHDAAEVTTQHFVTEVAKYLQNI